jgi:hypothetical protein
MKRYIYNLDPDIWDDSYSDDSDSTDESDTEGPTPTTGAIEADVVEDATFHKGLEVPPKLRVTTYLNLVEHFRQQPALHEVFLKVFRNCSFISSRS